MFFAPLFFLSMITVIKVREIILFFVKNPACTFICILVLNVKYLLCFDSISLTIHIYTYCSIDQVEFRDVFILLC